VGIKRQIHEHSQYIQFTYYKLRYYSLVNVMQEIGLAKKNNNSLSTAAAFKSNRSQYVGLHRATYADY